MSRILHTAAAQRLLAELAEAQGFWPGALSSSALATALAAFALGEDNRDAPQVAAALSWLAGAQNADGGWGDSPESPSNRTTTLICRTVLRHSLRRGADSARPADTPPDREKTGRSIARSESWLAGNLGELSGARIREAILADYGSDRTFSAPILSLLAIAGDIGWREVPQLPFELAVFPHALFRWIRMPVVSYALPALIAIGLARHRQCAARHHPCRWLRERLVTVVLRRLARLQPEGGGFLEAAPLTAFVMMNLRAGGCGGGAVAENCRSFLRNSQRPDGSWPIDTDLATWLTSLAVDALAIGGGGIAADAADAIRNYLLKAQFRRRHPYTGARRGGWAWTHRAGGVPDADDTSGALIALWHLRRPGEDQEPAAAAGQGLRWLLGVQNRDGGFPAFCKGRGHLPFDRSSPDITAHALRAMLLWHTMLPRWRRRLATSLRQAVDYLRLAQEPDGAWLPLWFGNQNRPDGANPVYGTARVVAALAPLCRQTDGCREGKETLVEMRDRGVALLRNSQHADGGWGGDRAAPPSIEETALATGALLAAVGECPETVAGRNWLRRATAAGCEFPAAPIGLYFARLWYSEKLYPIIHAAALPAGDGQGAGSGGSGGSV